MTERAEERQDTRTVLDDPGIVLDKALVLKDLEGDARTKGIDAFLAWLHEQWVIAKQYSHDEGSVSVNGHVTTIKIIEVHDSNKSRFRLEVLKNFEDRCVSLHFLGGIDADALHKIDVYSSSKANERSDVLENTGFSFDQIDDFNKHLQIVIMDEDVLFNLLERRDIQFSKHDAIS